jgi:hypothetical protein
LALNPFTKFNQLWESIHPDNTIRRYERRRDTALNTFSCGDERFESLEAFDKYFLRFYKHVMAHLWNVDSDFAEDNHGAMALMYNKFVQWEFAPHVVYTAYHYCPNVNRINPVVCTGPRPVL